ncbi:putative late blight resistance protein R1A-10 [Salvia divinorum]|uniref:Late blight resistance protein R1A-10 n=1 Tax=Salvia divinorum TaxID=28513 RepID=A0ABD1FSA1_SALDI
MAYAAVISLKHTIQRLTNLPITKSAYEELILLESTLKKLDDNSNNSIDRSAINELDAQIREAACKLEVALESYHSDGVEARSQIPPVDLKGVVQEIHSFVKTAKQLKEDYNTVLDNPLPIEEEEDDAVPPKEDVDCKKSTTVELSDQLEKIIIEFLDLQSRLKIVSIFGMAGIGKTHLARKIYEDERITGEYDVLVWASIGPNFHIKKILADIAAHVIVARILGDHEKTVQFWNEPFTCGLCPANKRERRAIWKFLSSSYDKFIMETLMTVRTLKMAARWTQRDCAVNTKK